MEVGSRRQKYHSSFYAANANLTLVSSWIFSSASVSHTYAISINEKVKKWLEFMVL